MTGPPKTYEEANWDKLSPAFRVEHNRLRQARGLPPIPPPVIDRYVKPKAVELRVPSAEDEKAAMEELGSPDVFSRDGCGGMRVWVGLNEKARERLRVEKNQLALKAAWPTPSTTKRQLQDRKLKTKALHAAIIKVATMFLTTAPEANRTMPNARAAVMRFFGAKRKEKSGRRVWRDGEVGERTVDYVLKHISVDNILKANEPLVPPEDIGDGVTERKLPSAPPPSRTPEEQQAWERKMILDGIKTAEDSGDEVTAKILRRALSRAR